ncbi:hypothetical protein [Magnetospira sp. QH-2]|uniref:hypothetical protein n=1 Tax=Magnetospira sp. (strain QH-2) TaxID=1288970 RepID=UPI0003E80AEB|nr:hypothetical protein [Magnetospira sp. QH-2]CCQ75140.1 membrane protein of unknown function [Magnetospira sp. QH-2]
MYGAYEDAGLVSDDPTGNGAMILIGYIALVFVLQFLSRVFRVGSPDKIQQYAIAGGMFGLVFGLGGALFEVYVLMDVFDFSSDQIGPLRYLAITAGLGYGFYRERYG